MPRAEATKSMSSNPKNPAPALMRMTVYLPEEEWTELGERAEKADTTVTNLVRRSVRAYLESN